MSFYSYKDALINNTHLLTQPLYFTKKKKKNQIISNIKITNKFFESQVSSLRTSCWISFQDSVIAGGTNGQPFSVSLQS